MVDKCLLDRMKVLTFGNPFNGRNPAAIRLDSKNQAGVHRASVKNNRTGAAVPYSAPFLRTEKIKIFPEHLGKGTVGRYSNLIFFIIYKKRY
jgi:hypothetical protein